MKIKNSGQIIQKFKDLFNKNLKLFLEGNYLEFLEIFQDIRGMNKESIVEINKELQNKLEYLQDTEMDIVVLYTIVLSGLITKIRDYHFNAAIDEVKARVKSRIKIHDDEIQERLNNLFMRNNKNISLLYNLSYINALAQSFNYNRVAHTCKIQMGKYLNRTVNLIISASK